MTMKRAQGASRRAWAAIIALLWLCISAPSSTAAEEAFTQQLSALQAGDFAEKEAAVDDGAEMHNHNNAMMAAHARRLAPCARFIVKAVCFLFGWGGFDAQRDCEWVRSSG